jgi:hypothetical protein
MKEKEKALFQKQQKLAAALPYTLPGRKKSGQLIIFITGPMAAYL